MVKLDHTEILELHKTAVAAGLEDSKVALMTGIDRDWVAQLPSAPSPAGQLMVDLDCLSEAGALADGTTPLEVWLTNAVRLAGSRVEGAVFRRFLEQFSTGEPSPLPPPTPFAALIEEKTRDFVGRTYVFSALEHFMATFPSGYFFVMGHPGTGKSAIIAEYARRTNCLVHFNQSTLNQATVAVFLESLNEQVAARRGTKAAPLPARAADDGRFLEALLRDLAPAAVSKPLVVAIDALDEVDMRVARSTPLFLPRALPRGVFLLVSTRPAPLFAVDTSSQCFDLDEHLTACLEDAAAYVRLIATRPELRKRLEDRRIDLDLFVETLARKSAGNFMYLCHVLPAIASGGYESLAMDSLPSGLEAYYEDHWTRMGMRADPLPRAKLRVLYVLSEVPEPMSRDLLAAVVHEEPLAVQQVLTAWRPFLHSVRAGGQHRYHLYHASFRDFLRRQDVLSASGVSLEEIRGMIAVELLRGREDDV